LTTTGKTINKIYSSMVSGHTSSQESVLATSFSVLLPPSSRKNYLGVLMMQSYITSKDAPSNNLAATAFSFYAHGRAVLCSTVVVFERCDIALKMICDKQKS
jgi:hypothetical protein